MSTTIALPKKRKSFSMIVMAISRVMTSGTARYANAVHRKEAATRESSLAIRRQAKRHRSGECRKQLLGYTCHARDNYAECGDEL
jgi:hypothetical protein